MPVARAVIHDLGYQRYAGLRLPQSTRWRVIMRNQLSAAWKNWWRYKAWIGLSVLITVVLGAIMVALRQEVFNGIRQNGIVVSFVDGMVFGSIRFYVKVGFLVTLTCGAGIVANDLRTGAFTFYFSRPVRPIDYLLGKIAGLFILQAFVLLLPMLVLTFVRLGVSDSTDELVANLELIPKIVMVGGLASLAFATVSLGFSSLFSNRALSIGLWAGYYVIVSSIFVAIGVGTKNPDIAALDFPFALSSMAFHLFHLQSVGTDIVASQTASILGVVANIAAGAGLAYWRISANAHSGIGGA
jgi:ABC-type transport system involved in multi-copper enzyme maturation permease subunit